MIAELYLNSRCHKECDDETFEGEDEPGFLDELLEAGPVDCLKLEELRFDIELDNFTRIGELGRDRTCESGLLE